MYIEKLVITFLLTLTIFTMTLQAQSTSSNQNNNQKPKEADSEMLAAKEQERGTINQADADKRSGTRTLEDLEQLLIKQSEEIRLLRQQLQEQSERIKQLEQKEAISPHSSSGRNSKEENIASAMAVTGQQEQLGAQRIAAVEKAQQRLEEQVRKIGGPFRFGGDFRLRLDTITRSSQVLADGTRLPGVQNVRGRYRLRFNFDADINPQISFHGQIATGPINNGLTMDQDFTATIVRHPFFISEAWIDYHPNKSFSIQGGRVQGVFADNSRFLFDDDVRFNGFNEKFVHTFKTPALKLRSMELRAGQYFFSNPNVAIIREGDPISRTGAEIGTRARASQMFHQGILLNQTLSENVEQQIGTDIQLFRNPSQIALASTSEGVALIVEPGLGLRLSGPVTGAGNAVTTPGGALYTARNFQVARLTYSLNHKGIGDRRLPLSFNVQLARNVSASFERDALLAALSLGQTRERGNWRILYLFSIKGANSMISQLTDDDLGTGTGVNLRAHHLRFDIALAKGIVFQNLFFFQNELRSSSQFPGFFVPLGAFTPLQFRFQQQLAFSF